MTTPSDPAGDPAPHPLYSTLAGDDEMADLISYFVAELSNRVEALQAAFTEGDEDRLRMLAHQIKGAAGGYGFPAITAVAGDLERVLQSDGRGMSEVDRQVRDLIDLCRRARV
ncbi:MAG: Hpt domain-containing protein [Phycisphaeraceae bacterium]|nr:Hpt domain-containing protein [Phycisphaeraceae bacterium]